MRYILTIFLLAGLMLVQDIPADILAYESFDYSTSPLGVQGEGLGFAGSWHKDVTLSGLSGSSLMDVVSGSLQYEGLHFVPEGAKISSGASGNKACRELGISAVTDMTDDGVRYLSFLLNVNDFSGGSIKILWGSVNQDAIVDPVELVFQQDGSIDIVSPSTASDSDALINIGVTYFVVVKLITDSIHDNADYDQIFVKVYRSGQSVDRNEYDISWTMVSDPGVHFDESLNYISFDGNTLADFSIDEIRIASQWRSAVGLEAEMPQDDLAAGDMNADYSIDLQDLVLFAAQWLK